MVYTSNKQEAMNMITSIQKWGNSQGIRLPKNILTAAGLSASCAVKIVAEPDRIVIHKIDKRKHRSLQELFQSYKGETTCEEWDTGTPVGKEIF